MQGAAELCTQTIDVNRASLLMGCTERTITRKVNQGVIPAASVRGAGRNGVNYRIPIANLSPEAMSRYMLMQAGMADADLAAYRERYGEAGLAKLVGRLQAVMEMRALKGRKDAAGRRAEIAAQMGVLPRCVYDWEHKYDRDGLEGLMDKTMRSDKGKSRALCPLAQDRANYLYMAPGKVSQNRVWQNLVELRDKLGAKVCEECCHNPESMNREDMIARGYDPGEACRKVGNGLIVGDSRCALNRYVANLDPAVITLGRYGEKPFDDLYIPKCRRDKPEKVNDVWFGDHHVFDLFVLDDQGTARRPWLTAWMDACSGCLVGWKLSFHPNSATISESLALGIAKTVGSPFWGAPMWLYIDNGKDYRSKLIEGVGDQTYQPGIINGDISGDNALLKCLGIGYHHALPYRARSKTIERAFGTIEGQWIRSLPGYCGNGIDLKPETLMSEIRAGRILTFEAFAALWVNEILPKYHAYKGADGKSESPLEIYQSHERARQEVIGWPTLSIAMSEKCMRTIRTDGVYVNKVRYWDEAMALHIGRQVQVLSFRGAADFVGIMLGNQFLCVARKADNFLLLDEDEERLKEHLRMQAATRKDKLAALRLPAERVRVLDNMAMEVPDLAQGATISSLMHERAYGQLQAAQTKQQVRKDTQGKVSRSIRERINAAGNAVLDMPDVD